jgi:PhnB protein
MVGGCWRVLHLSNASRRCRNQRCILSLSHLLIRPEKAQLYTNRSTTAQLKQITKQNSTRLGIYVNFPGHCEEAFRFYKHQIGGKIISTARHSEVLTKPAPPDNWKNALLHTRLEIGNSVLMGADVPGAEPMRSASFTLRIDKETEAKRVYQILGEGGQIFLNMEQTFFASRFAMLRDRFGTSWRLLCEK